MKAIKWVATVYPSDSPPFHVMGSKRELEDLHFHLAKEFGAAWEEDAWKLQSKAATWECDGSDGCLLDS